MKMKAVTFQGIKDIQLKQVEDPTLQQQDDIIIRITSTAICGSDLHIYQGALPAAKDYVIGHEPMGIVEEVGPGVTRVKKGDRVVLLFLSDVLPTAYWSVENAGVKPGDTVTVLGSGPIGIMTQKFAWMKGAKMKESRSGINNKSRHLLKRRSAFWLLNFLQLVGILPYPSPNKTTNIKKHPSNENFTGEMPRVDHRFTIGIASSPELTLTYFII
ncbi:D-arabinose 1-dehydrogenase-like Zn-dependent alcohol dehydrogenase [Paenibacillus sp. 4624]